MEKERERERETCPGQAEFQDSSSLQLCHYQEELLWEPLQKIKYIKSIHDCEKWVGKGIILMLKWWFFYLWGFHFFFFLNHKNSFPNTELFNK